MMQNHDSSVPGCDSNFVLDTSAPDYIRNPYPTYRWLREHAPAYAWPKHQAVVFSRYRDVKAIFKDLHFTTDFRQWEFATQKQRAPEHAEYHVLIDNWVLSLPEIDHLRVRKLASGALTRRSLEQMMRGKIQGAVDAAGGKLRRGQMVSLFRAAALHDPDIFPEPERFNIHRDLSQAINFGFGSHFCLGAALARLEIEVATSTLMIQRFPKIKLLESGACGKTARGRGTSDRHPSRGRAFTRASWRRSFRAYYPEHASVGHCAGFFSRKQQRQRSFTQVVLRLHKSGRL